MRKLASALLVLLSVSLCAAAEMYPSGWYSLHGDDGSVLSPFYMPYGCTVSLPDSMSLSPLETVLPFTAAPGIYKVPSDVPPGTYSVKCDDSSSWCIVSVWDDAGKLVISQVMHSDEGGVIASVPMSDGYSFEVEKGSAHFDAAVGVTFDFSEREESSDRLFVPKPGTSLLDVAESAVDGN